METAPEGLSRHVLKHALSQASPRVDVIQKTLYQLGDRKVPVIDEDKLLHMACSNGHVDVVRLLLREGGTAAECDADGKTAYEVAAHDKIVEVFQQELTASVAAGDAAKTSALLEAGLSVEYEESDNPLHWASLFGHAEVALLLLDRGGADVNALNGDGATALHISCQGGYGDMVRLLLSYRDVDTTIVATGGAYSGKTPADVASTDDIRAMLVAHAKQDLEADGNGNDDDMDGKDFSSRVLSSASISSSMVNEVGSTFGGAVSYRESSEDDDDDDDDNDDGDGHSMWSFTSGPNVAAAQYPLLWPPPKHLRRLPGGSCDFGGNIVVSLPDNAPADVAGVRSAAWTQLCTALGRHGVTLSPTRAPSGGGGGGGGAAAGGGSGSTGAESTARAALVDSADDQAGSMGNGGLALAINAPALPHPMGFRLTVCRQGVALVASDAQGLFYGVTCLCQLLDLYSERPDGAEGGGNSPASGPAAAGTGSGVMVALPAVCIEDYPDFAVRGVVIDARFPNTPRRERLLATVKELASWRINALHLVLDENHPAPGSNAVSESDAVASSSTPDLVELDAVCQHYFVTLIPSWASESIVSVGTSIPTATERGTTGGGAASMSAGEDSALGETVNRIPLDFFRQIKSRQLSLIFSQGNEPARNSPRMVARVVATLDAVARHGHYDTIHLWGLAPETLALVARDPLRWMPSVLTAVQDFPCGTHGTTSGSKANAGPTLQGAAISRYVKGGCSGLTGPALRSAPLVCSLCEAATTGLREGASGMLIQGLPWANPLYPRVFQKLCFFAGAGIAWGRSAASALLSVGPVATLSDTTSANSSTSSPPPALNGLSEERSVFKDLVASHLYGASPEEASFPVQRPDENAMSPRDILVNVAISSPEHVRRCWAARRSASPRELDQPLWQLHVIASALPAVLWGNNSASTLESLADMMDVGEQNELSSLAVRSEVLSDIGNAYKGLLSVMRGYDWRRQNSLRWMEPAVYAAAVADASPAEQSLDAIHVAIDLLRLSCRLVQQILLLGGTATGRQSGGDSDPPCTEYSYMGLARPVHSLVKLIPASTRSDLANRFLDLYQRFAVLWVRDFCCSGLPVAFRQPPELLELLTFDLPNFDMVEIFEKIFTPKTFLEHYGTAGDT